MFIWEWVLGWISGGEIVIFRKIGKVAKTLDRRPVARTNYSRAVAKTNYDRDYS